MNKSQFSEVDGWNEMFYFSKIIIAFRIGSYINNQNEFELPFFAMSTSIEHINLKRKPRSVSTFLKKTFDLLNEPQNQGCIKWAPNGIGFIVTNQELFSKTVLPKYFKHSNYSSFVRQLNMYNFHKIRENNSESYFHHECFDRDNRSAMSEIRRKPQKKKRKAIEEDDEEHSNFIEGQDEDSIPLKHKKSMKAEALSSYKKPKERQANCDPEKQHNNRIHSDQKLSIKMIDNSEVNIKAGPLGSGLQKGLISPTSDKQNRTTQQHVSETRYCQGSRENFSQEKAEIGCVDNIPFGESSFVGGNRNVNINAGFNPPCENRNVFSGYIPSNEDFSMGGDSAHHHQKVPQVTAKELFYPSTHNLFPFLNPNCHNNGHINTFTIFF